MRKHKVTDEEKAVRQLAKIISDVRLDLDLMGWFLAMYFPTVVTRRLNEVSEVANESKDKMSDGIGII
jgi:hypothetical protein